MVNVFYDIETLGLNPMKDRIVSIAIDKENIPYVFLNEDEKIMLREFWSFISRDDMLIGFNNVDFDFPFLIKRSLINNVIVENNVTHLDLRRVTNSFHMNYDKFVKGKLTDWAEIMGLPVETEDGSQMPIKWKNKEYENIRKHNLEDVKITKALYNRSVSIKLLEVFLD